MVLLLVAMGGTARADAVRWRTNLDAAKIEAAQSGRLVLLHFWSASCGPCRALDNQVFSQPHVGVEIEKNFVPVKISTDRSPAMASLFRINRVPTDIVLTPQGNPVSNLLQCPPTAEGYLTQLKKLADHYRVQTSGKNIAASETPFNAAYAGLALGQKATVLSNPSQPNHTAPQNHTVQQNRPIQKTAAQITNPWIAKTSDLPASTKAVATTPKQQAPVTIHSPFATSTPPAATSTVVQASADSTLAKSETKKTLSLPPGSPPLGFDGCCPVSLNFAHRWIPGDTKFGAVHRGRTYLFVGEAERQQFLANPDTFSPVFSGMDPVLMLDEKRAVEGSRKFGFKWRKTFHLFSSQATMDRFESNPDRYTAGIRQAMSLLDASSGTIRR